MTLYWLITNLIAALLLPPFSLILLAVAGLWLLRRKPRLGRSLIGTSLLLLWLLATPWVATPYLESLMPSPALLAANQADAIVILGGGRDKDTVAYGGDTVNGMALERVRYGAMLARKFNKPVLVTGGAPESSSRVSEGELMRRVLENEFHIKVRWVEDRSRNTLENATFSAAMLNQAKIKHIFLVSHAWHLGRAIPEFERLGFTVIPAGVGQKLQHGPEVFDFVPNAKSLLNSYYATHEWIGVLWYRLRHLSD